MSFNRVILMGNLTKEPELRVTPTGTQVANAGIAINNKYKTREGEYKEEVSFFNLVFWGKTAETVCKYFTKGSAIHIEGKLQQRTWEKEGRKHSAVDIVVETIQFIGKKQDNQETSNENNQ